MVPNVEYPDDLVPFIRRGGVWGAVAFSSIVVFYCFSLGFALDEDRMSWGLWVAIGISGLVSAFLGSRLSAQMVLGIVSLVFGLIMLGVVFSVLIRLQNWELAAEAGLCVYCSACAFCILASPTLSRRPYPTRLFWFLLVNALAATVLLGIGLDWVRILLSHPGDLPLLFLMFLPFWASVALAGRLRQDLSVPPEIPKGALAQDPQTNSPHDATDTFPMS